LAEFLNFSSLQTVAAILQAEPENSDSRNAGQAWPKGLGFSRQNKAIPSNVDGFVLKGYYSKKHDSL